MLCSDIVYTQVPFPSISYHLQWSGNGETFEYFMPSLESVSLMIIYI